MDSITLGEFINGEQIAMRIAGLGKYRDLVEVGAHIKAAETRRDSEDVLSPDFELNELRSKLRHAEQLVDEMNELLDRAHRHPKSHEPLDVFDNRCDPEKWRGQDIWELVAPVPLVADYFWIEGKVKEAQLIDPDVKHRHATDRGKARRKRIHDAVMEEERLEVRGARARVAERMGLTPQRVGQIVNQVKKATKKQDENPFHYPKKKS